MFHVIKLSLFILVTFVFVELPGGPWAACGHKLHVSTSFYPLLLAGSLRGHNMHNFVFIFSICGSTEIVFDDYTS